MSSDTWKKGEGRGGGVAMWRQVRVLGRVTSSSADKHWSLHCWKYRIPIIIFDFSFFYSSKFSYTGAVISRLPFRMLYLLILLPLLSIRSKAVEKTNWIVVSRTIALIALHYRSLRPITVAEKQTSILTVNTSTSNFYRYLCRHESLVLKKIYI